MVPSTFTRRKARFGLLEGGAVVDRRIATTRDRLTAVFWGRPRMRILLEAATESEWVAQHLETLGHEVIVADPISRRCMATAAAASRPIDGTWPPWRRCQRGCYRVAHRRSAPRRTVQAQLNIRRELTEARTRAISLTRAIVRGGGFRIRSGSTGSFLTRVAALDLPSSMTETLLPLRSVIELLDAELTKADETFAQQVVDDAVVRRLRRCRASVRLRRARTSRRWMTPRVSAERRRSRAISVWCRASIARASSNAAGA